MPKKSVPPAKLACLVCRATKTRCDGQYPCSKCLSKDLDCSYKPSRRGGPRRGPRYHSQINGTGNQPDKSLTPESLTTTSTTGSSTFLQAIPAREWQYGPKDHDTSEQSIALFHSTPNVLAVSSEFIDGMEPCTLGNSPASASDGFQKADAFSMSKLKPSVLTLRCYKSEEDILNSYYIYIHPYISLLPGPQMPQYNDRPEMIRPSHSDERVIDHSIFPHWPHSSLGLAISAILTMIPLPEDPSPFSDASVSMRRSYAQEFAESALRKADSEIDIITNCDSAPTDEKINGRFHPDVQSSLNPILALTILGIYELCQRGSLTRMRNRANYAITTAMDISLHSLGTNASESERRAWWGAVAIHFQSSIRQFTQPIITMNDPRITTPLPTFNAMFEPWIIFLRAQDVTVSAITLLQNCKLEQEDVTLPADIAEKILRMDAEILNIISLSDCAPRQSDDKNLKAVESLASQNMWMVSRLMAHSARLRLHRFRAFLDIPIFLEKHCDLAAIYSKDTLPLPQSLSGPQNLNSVFPFTSADSCLICLKSSLVIARVFKNLSNPHPCYTDDVQKSEPCQAMAQVYPRSLPFFACAAMQSSYVLFMLHHRLNAALTSEQLSTCYYLLNRPQNETEHQDAERLIDEMRSGVESMVSSLKSDSIFEGISSMSQEIEVAYQSTLLQ